MCSSFRRISDCENGRKVNARRKYSFPNLKDSIYNLRPVERERLQKIRKVRSTSDTTWPSQRPASPMPHCGPSGFALLNELVVITLHNI